MKTRTLAVIGVVLLAGRIGVQAQGTAFTYQGRLNDGGGPANGTYDLRFAVYDALTDGEIVGTPLTNSAVVVSNGLFTATVDFGPDPFSYGAERWLEIGVRTNGSTADFTALAPFQPITPTPYAIAAETITGSLPATKLSGEYPGAVILDSFWNEFTGDGSGLRSVNAVNALRLGGLEPSQFWQLGGNAGTLPGTNFLGTLDQQPLELRVNGFRALRLEPGRFGYANLLGGSSNNVVGKFIGGSVIGGGSDNLIEGFWGTIGGGYFNSIGSNAFASTIPGGYQNSVAEAYSFAGGYRAKATSHGTFVWADDSEDADFASTADNQFAVRAGGGVRFETRGVGMTLDGQPVLSGQITSGQLADNAITTSKLAPDSVTSSAIGSSQVTTAQIADGTIVDADISLAAGIADTKLGTISTSGKIANSATSASSANTPNSIVARNSSGNFSASTINATAFAGDGNALIGLNASSLASGTVPDARLAPNIARTNQVWLLGTGAPDTQSLGTSENSPLELKVNNQRALRLEPTPTNDTVNVIGGSGRNYVASGIVGVTIGGGGSGYTGTSNAIRSDFGTIAGGGGNDVGARAEYTTLGGGLYNKVAVDSKYGVVAGGGYNSIGTNSWFTVIGGGSDNIVYANSSEATISGGQWNQINRDSDGATIAGGGYNHIAAGSYDSTISGGARNEIGTNCNNATIGGGFRNEVRTDAWSSTLSGGEYNQIGTNAAFSTIGGGGTNSIAPQSPYSTIAGGTVNDIGTNASRSVIGGGEQNNIAANSAYSIIVGGDLNDIGTNSAHSSILGGHENNILDNCDYCTIAGGIFNNIATNADYSTIAGGWQNNIAGRNSESSTIAGGHANTISTDSAYSVIGGGFSNTVGTNSSYATIPGGINNFATNSAFAAGTRAKANHSGAFVWADPSGGDVVSTNANSVTMRAAGGYRLFSSSGTVGVYLAANSSGWIPISDRNAKENFESVNARAVLEKVATLPMSTWNYKTQTNGVRHIGAMAQDFKAAFEVGETDTGINTVDADGVALAAIQGLNQKLEEQLRSKEAEIQELKSAVGDLKKMIRELANQTKD